MSTLTKRILVMCLLGSMLAALALTGCGGTRTPNQATLAAYQATQAVLQPTFDIINTQSAEQGIDVGTVTGPYGPVFTNDDGYPTTLVTPIDVGQTQNQSLDEFGAHNWLFTGMAGQTVTITVRGVGVSTDGSGDSPDPEFYLLDPIGEEIGDADDNDDELPGLGEYDAQLTIQLPMDGIYTVRVEMYSGGEYSITIK